MIYFTMRFGNGLNQLYYAYLNKEFTAFESEPQLLFQYPKSNKNYIDGDMPKVGNKYHLFYVAHDGVPGISKLFQTTRMDPISMMIVSMTLSQKPVKLRMCGKG